MWMIWGFGENIFDNTPGKLAGALILFQHNEYGHAGFNVGAGLPIRRIHIQILIIQTSTSWLLPFSFKNVRWRPLKVLYGFMPKLNFGIKVCIEFSHYVIY